MVKRVLSVFFAFFLACGLCPASALATGEIAMASPAQAGMSHAQDAAATDPLHACADQDVTVSGKSAAAIVRDMKVGWNLGNTLEAWLGDSDGNPVAATEIKRTGRDTETLWGNPKAAPELIAFVKAQGFNAVRIPVSWFQHVYDDGANRYHIDEAWMARVHEVVDYCYDQGLYVVLNTHHEKLWLETPQFGDDGEHREALNAQLAALWQQIAMEFAGYDQRLVFEGLNEPRAAGEGISHAREWGSPTAGDIETLNQLNQTFVDTVRAVASPYRTTRLLLVPTMSGSTQLPMISQVKVPELADRSAIDPYVGISAHPYQPYHFVAATHDSWMDHTWSAENQVTLEQVLYGMYATFASKGVPVVLDEFNAQDCDNTAARVEWANCYLGLARGYGMTCFLWDNGSTGKNDFGNATRYVDRTAAPLAWVNDNQARVASAIVAAATDENTVTWGSALDTPVPGSSPTGLQLNQEPATTTGNSVCAASVRWADIAQGDVAVEFSGDAPLLVMTTKAGNGWTTASPSWVSWNSDATGGVAYYWPDHVRRLWQASTQNADAGVEHTLDALRQLKVVTGGSSTTVTRVILTGVDALPAVSNGSYGEGVGVRLLYTRPVTLVHDPNDSSTLDAPYPWRTVAINTENPDVAGKDYAVRFTGTAPYLVFVDMADDHGWHGWTSVRPYALAAADDGTGQKVAFFSSADIAEAWEANRAKDGESWRYDSVSVAVSGGTCNLVELVALGGTVRERPVMRAASQALSRDEIVDALYAGYNLGGHLESNYDSGTQTKDGGWGDADLDLEAHWSRGTYIERQTITDLKARGFKTVRLPVTWYQHIYAYGNDEYHIDRAWLARVHEIVDWCLEEDLYVIVNLHHENWIDRTDLDTAYDTTDLPQKFAAVWSQIAREFDGYDQRLIFESMNEPHAAGDPTDREWNQPNAGDVATVNRLNADFVALMRGLDPTGSLGHRNRLLLVPPFAASVSGAAATGFVMPDDPSGCTAVSLHCYAPHSYTHYLQDKSLDQDDGSSNVFTETYSIQVDAAFESIRSNFTSKGLRVVLGEFGCYYCTEARQPDRLRWMTQYATHAKELGVPLLYWRMDKSMDGAVIWSVYDEVKHAWSVLSRDMVDKWFSILEDDGIVWGARAAIDEGEHAAMESGKQLLAERTVLDRSTGTSSYVRMPLTWAELDGCEVAVKYSGGTPRLGMLKGWNGDWWGIAPTSTDAQAGIAYYSARAVKARWEETLVKDTTDQYYTVADLDHVILHMDTNLMSPESTIDSIAVIHKHEWGYWTQPRAATCTEPAEQTRMCDNGVHEAHVQARKVSSSLGHAWGVPSYAWSADGSRVTATVSCTRDARHVETETATAVYSVVKQPAPGQPGLGRYIATFANALFATQVRDVPIQPDEAGVIMYRLYNPWSGGHLYTSDTREEIPDLVALGWENEGLAWTAPATSAVPVLRLYNPWTGDHHFTTDEGESATMQKAGWTFEGTGWYSAESSRGVPLAGAVPLFRGFNKWAQVGTHHYTADRSEIGVMVAAGWQDEGIAWYGI